MIAVKSGKIPKASSLICNKCKIRSAIDYHHYKGYDYPLDVIPLCRSCHRSEEF